MLSFCGLSDPSHAWVCHRCIMKHLNWRVGETVCVVATPYPYSYSSRYLGESFVVVLDPTVQSSPLAPTSSPADDHGAAREVRVCAAVSIYTVGRVDAWDPIEMCFSLYQQSGFGQRAGDCHCVSDACVPSWFVP